MRITFNQNDFLSFFNMVSVYKTYVEVANKVDIEPPRSAIDLLLYKLATMVVEHHWYDSTINDVFPIIQFMLGTAKCVMDNDVATAFNIQGQSLTIDMKKLWNYLLENGIEI